MSVSAEGITLQANASEGPWTEPAAALAAISHGTSSAHGQAVVAALAEQVAQAARGAEKVTQVKLGHVDVQQPDIAATLDSLPEGTPAVLVPLLLSAGFHVNVDMREAVEDTARPVTIAGAMGPDERLVKALAQRLSEAGADPQRDQIVLGGAGSSDTSAQADVRETAEMLADFLGAPVTASFLSFAEPTVADAVAEARAAAPGGRVAIASYLLAPGYFQDKLGAQGADLVTEPLLSIPDGTPDIPAGLAEMVLDRFAEALTSL
ncbi:sirohydrochlorin chelatase [Nesterenkonia populi]|uniref:sirohydrochlorin chelatase n=1 Tax=Nesterenkonia populi TaxID=1591087 RepID=UPI0011BEDA13|nr:CbiX/SirB N-terminal domain-containing protein [Nesterenkonia populi]